VSESLEGFLRIERGRVLATLIRFTGDIGLAEDAVQDAVVVALEHWPRTGMPRNPGAWLTITARNKALDRIRRESKRSVREQVAQSLSEVDAPLPTGAVRDDQLRLLFTCCHPALSPEARVALALRTICGLSTAEIARVHLLPEARIGQRISRAKAKIAGARIPYKETDWAQIAVLYALLEDIAPSPVVRVNRAVAVAYHEGPEAGLRLLDTVDATAVRGWHLYWSTRAELLKRAGRIDDAIDAYQHALACELNDSDRRFLKSRLRSLDALR
jgi:RNA polymerase sigma factor (sigma-70 family)